MTADQLILFALLIALFAFLLWGRWRYDLVAFAALVIALVVGVVPAGQAFAGFGHPATALILGPGGYRFGDYWRMGLPLEVLIVLVAIPTILVVWPL